MLISQGKLAHLEREEGYQATVRVLTALGMDKIQWNDKTAAPAEEQFWGQYDSTFNLTETEMRKALPSFVLDESSRAQVQALLDSDDQEQGRIGA